MSDLRAALVAIQELHKPWNNFDSADEELVCDHCREAHGYEWDYVPYPCPTRRLADDALGGETNG